MKIHLAYIDESGDPHFNDGASATYFVLAVLMPFTAQDEVSRTVDNIKQKYGLKQLKSSQESNFSRRLEICERLATLDIKILSLKVNKSALHGDWFRRKQTFYKFIQATLNHEIYRLYEPASVSIDRYGSPEYQRSFREYIDKKLQKDLFEPTIKIESARDNGFIQISDFIAGSIRKSMEKALPDSEKILSLFRPRWIVNLQIPDQGTYVKPIPFSDNKSSLIVCLEEAWRFLETNKSSTDDPRIRTLEYLYYTALEGTNDWVFTHEILEWLREMDINISEEEFRTNVTASLRDEGLVIVSSRRGLKIPMTENDLQEYIQFSVNLALPVLKRLKKAITFVTEKTEFKEIKELLSDEMQRILNEVDA